MNRKLLSFICSQISHANSIQNTKKLHLYQKVNNSPSSSMITYKFNQYFSSNNNKCNNNSHHQNYNHNNHSLNSTNQYKKSPLSQKLQKYYQQNTPLNGYCNYQATFQLAKGHHPTNWKQIIKISQKDQNTPYLSSLGFGTMNGQPTNEQDYIAFQALVTSLNTKGINVIDTCPNFRFGKSQKVINAALNYLIKQKSRKRQQFFIQTKAGFIPQDVDSNLSEKKIIQFLLQDKIITKQDIIQDIHCVAPGFLNFSVQKSRLTLGLNTIDVVYLNNFAQAHLAMVGQQIFHKRLIKAFETFQQMRKSNRIKYYGVCSFVCFRSPETEQKVYASFQKMIQAAKKVGGQNHGMRFVMLPINLGMPQALLKWQKYKGQLTTILQIAKKQRINLISCTPLFQGRLVTVPFAEGKMNQIKEIPGKHLQLIRSLKSSALVSTILSQNTLSHIQQNMKIIDLSKLSQQQWDRILPIPN